MNNNNTKAINDKNEQGYWDVVIIGAGPAGLTASLTTVHRGLATLVIEAKESPGGQPHFLYAEKRIIDIPGFPDGITGEEISSRVYRQAINAGVEFQFNEELVRIDDTDQTEKGDSMKKVITSQGEYLCRKAIIAVGLLHYPRKLPALDALNSKKIHYKNPKIGDYDGQTVAIVGGGDSALDAAIMVLERNGQVIQIIRESEPVGKADSLDRIRQSGNAEIMMATEITNASYAGDELELTLSDNSKIKCSQVIVQIGFISAKDTFKELNIRLKEDGSIVVDPYFETSRKGIFAVGDVHGDIELVTVAWAEGIQAAIYAFKEISSPYWLNERRLKDQRMALIGDKIIAAASSQDIPGHNSK